LAAFLSIPVVYWIVVLLGTYLGAALFGAMVQGNEKQYIGLGAMTLAAALACAAATALAPDHRLVGFVAAAAFSFKENMPRPQHFTAELPALLATALGVLCAAVLVKYCQSKRSLQNISS
jgi:hypothetical protein